MKILLVKSYPKLTSIKPLAVGLKEIGHDVHILVNREHPDCKKNARYWYFCPYH
ncbi:MAG: hypothetical protein PHH17_03570 [Candidatus Pacebacteria bacterium]|nr:hypothetical protein [Candidatus Paceibacterota bacterium]MDD4201259.1 hypothetical protein [Candidatus Paceibacterota bacterium]MDD5446249.1 hypothetical protein [Candidatus Paceibacterota bacterium]